MSEQAVTEARAMLDKMDSEWPDEAKELSCRCSLCVFENAAPRLVRGLLAEVDRLRDGGSMASATRKDAAPTAAEPAVLHASIDPPAIEPHGTLHEWEQRMGVGSYPPTPAAASPVTDRLCGCGYRESLHKVGDEGGVYCQLAKARAALASPVKAFIDPPAVAPVDEPSDETLAIWADGRFCDETSAMLARALLARRRAADNQPALRQKVTDYLALPVTTDIPPEPRCCCTHRWAEHYGPCQRPGCGCRAFVEQPA